MRQTLQLLEIKKLFQPAPLLAYLYNPLKSRRRRNTVWEISTSRESSEEAKKEADGN